MGEEEDGGAIFVMIFFTKPRRRGNFVIVLFYYVGLFFSHRQFGGTKKDLRMVWKAIIDHLSLFKKILSYDLYNLFIISLIPFYPGKNSQTLPVS